MAPNSGDRVYTPDWIVRDMVSFFRPSGRILEPSKGKGAFLQHLPPCDWCEIDDGKDFFFWNEKVDWIIGNPPYSLTKEFLRHSFKYAQNVAFLVPPWKVFSGYGTIRNANRFGNMKNIRWYGTGGSIGFPMGNGIAALHWEKDYRGTITETFFEDENRDSQFDFSAVPM